MDIILSDLHIGNSNSTLMTKEAEKVVGQFVTEVTNIGSKVEKLILLGDVFDFWDISLPQALKKARMFFEKINEITEKVIYVPGNHDHHSLILCEEMERIKKMENGKVPHLKFRDILKYEFPKASDNFVEAELLKGLFPRLPQCHIQLFYPEYRCTWKGKEILFRHGHYLDSGFFRVMPWIAEHLGRKIETERDFEIVNTPIYEHLYCCGAVPEINDLYQRIFSFINNFLDKIHEKNKHKNIKSRKEDIEKFFTKFKQGNYPEIFIFGHTHFADSGQIGDTEIFNSGCWIKEKNISHINTYITIDDEIEVRVVGGGRIF